jgi:hypothetical protein
VIDQSPKSSAAKPGWLADFATIHEAFQLLLDKSERFIANSDFPDHAALNAMATALDLKTASGLPLNFVAAKPKPRGPARRRHKATGDYEQRIFTLGEVSTRSRNWHDFFNALVWATFPRAKGACNARQIAARLPGIVRTREQDRLTMFDEGGIITVTDPHSQNSQHLIFGHAIYEAIVKGDTSMRAIQLPVILADSGDSTDSTGVRAHQNLIKQVDELVANAITGEIFTADHFDSIKVSEAFVAQ